MMYDLGYLINNTPSGVGAADNGNVGHTMVGTAVNSSGLDPNALET